MRPWILVRQFDGVGGMGLMRLMGLIGLHEAYTQAAF